MTTLIFFTNNTYYVATTDGRTPVRKLNCQILESIFPKHIVRYDNNRHFILDINNNLHIIKLDHKQSLNYYCNIWSGSAIDPIMMKVHVFDPNCRILLFEFNKDTNTFTIEIIQIRKYEDSMIHRTRKPKTVRIHNITNYEFVKHDSIILHGPDNQTYVYNNETFSFDVLYDVKYKLCVMNGIYAEHDNKVYKTKIVRGKKNQTLAIRKMLMPIPENIIYKYIKHFRPILVTSKGNELYVFDDIITVDMSNFIKALYMCNGVVLVFNNEIILVNAYSGNITRISLNNFVDSDNLIMHGITRKFVWTRDNHHYLS